MTFTTSKAHNHPHTVSCHCGNVRGSFSCSDQTIKAWECNCSDCAMRGNVHFVVPGEGFVVEGTEKEYHAKTSLYLWGTKTAQRRFCRTCGILPWYVPRSNPDGIAITLACASFAGGKKTQLEICQYDGINWEKSHAESGISNESQQK
mmetsp:Transcript_4875/g.8326  ORF Transcript_4875/g.8326 Transcript_4875/m.8326 type:complete len:148 (-) Transcript_4875:388-831(-)